MLMPICVKATQLFTFTYSHSHQEIYTTTAYLGTWKPLSIKFSYTFLCSAPLPRCEELQIFFNRLWLGKNWQRHNKTPTKGARKHTWPRTPPENSSVTSWVTRSADMQRTQQAPATTRENMQTDRRAMPTVSQEVSETPPIEDRELGVTIAPSMPNIKSTPCQQDENTDAGTRETIEHTRDSWPKESPKKPTMGNAASGS